MDTTSSSEGRWYLFVDILKNNCRDTITKNSILTLFYKQYSHHSGFYVLVMFVPGGVLAASYSGFPVVGIIISIIALALSVRQISVFLKHRKEVKKFKEEDAKWQARYKEREAKAKEEYARKKKEIYRKAEALLSQT